MAAPPLQLQSSYIKVQTFSDHSECGALVLHLQPRPQATGLEIAVYTGRVHQCADGADRMDLDARSELHAVPETAAALAAFAASMIETGPARWWDARDEGGGVCALGLRLPSKPPKPAKGGGSGGSSGWSSASVELHAPGDVVPTVNTYGRSPTRSAGLTFNEDWAVSATPVHVSVHNPSERYARQQAALAGGTAPPPDPPEAFARRWRELRDGAAADLAAALTAVLQRAVSYRGHIPPPSPQYHTP